VKGAAKWRSLPLTEAFWFQEGPGVRNWQFTTSGIKLLNVANIEKNGMLNLEKTDRHLDETEVASKYSHFLVDAGDLVIASSGISFDDDGLLRTRGAFVCAKHLPLCLNTSTIRFKAIDGVSDLRFLRLWLNGREFRSQITKLVTGTAQQNFGPSHLKATKITLPPLAEQRRIAEVLDRAEALRAKRRAALAQLDSLTQSIFLDMFGDPAANGWAITDIAGVAKPETGSIRTGPFGSQLLHSEFTDHGIAVLGIDNAVANEFQWSELRFISEAKYRQLKRYTVRPGDVLITIMGTCGRCAIVPDDIPPAINTKHLCCITLDPAKCLSLFLHAYFLQHPIARKYLTQTAKGAIMSGLNMGLIKELPIPLAPIDLQREFARRVRAVEKLKMAQRASLAELDALFPSLQHRAFRGEL
jgi:type I restriction enzyme, S subunit